MSTLEELHHTDCQVASEPRFAELAALFRRIDDEREVELRFSNGEPTWMVHSSEEMKCRYPLGRDLRLEELKQCLQRQKWSRSALNWILFSAANVGNVEIMELATLHGADPDGIGDEEEDAWDEDYEPDTEDCWAPLHAACAWQAWDAVEHLLEWGANPNIRDHYGDTPLHMSARSGCGGPDEAWGAGPVLGALLRKGADMEALDGDGRTPLQIAIEWRAYKDAESGAIETLYRAGAKLDRKWLKGFSMSQALIQRVDDERALEAAIPAGAPKRRKRL